MPIRPPVRLLSPILLERDRLIDALRQTINHTFSAAASGCVGTPGEVDRLVYFFLEGLPLIEDQFNRILAAHSVHATLSGIFCHQTPKVEPSPSFPSSAKTCELGDILFLVTYGKRLYDRFVGNALLVQAKENAGSLAGTLQEHLYSQATDFIYSSPRRLSGQQRWLAECQNALWYWDFDGANWWPGTPSRQTAGIPARSSAHALPYRPFEFVLADLICGVTGRRTRMLRPTDPEAGWSKIVDDLLRHTSQTALRRQNAYVSRNQEPLRGEDAIRAVNSTLGPQSPFLIRSSLGRIFSIFDDELAEIGRKLEHEGQNFDQDTFRRKDPKRFSERDHAAPPPTLGNDRPGSRDDDNGGCSFVVMDFSPL